MERRTWAARSLRLSFSSPIVLATSHQYKRGNKALEATSETQESTLIVEPLSTPAYSQKPCSRNYSHPTAVWHRFPNDWPLPYLPTRKTSRPYETVLQLGWRLIPPLSWNATLSTWIVPISPFGRHQPGNTLHPLRNTASIPMCPIAWPNRRGSASTIGTQDPGVEKKKPSKSTLQGNGTSSPCKNQLKTLITTTWRIVSLWLTVEGVRSCSIRTLFTQTSRFLLCTSMIPETCNSRSWKKDNQDGLYRVSSHVHHFGDRHATANRSFSMMSFIGKKLLLTVRAGCWGL